jgi:hypothetical protein
MIKKLLVASASCVLALITMIHVTGCSVDSANSVARSVSVNVAGFYAYDSGNCANNQDRFVSANSGKQVISLNLRQIGDQLEAIDNNGIIFRGTIGNETESSASFNLSGATTEGRAVVISGSIAIGGGEGVMRATWIEDTFFATLCGSANGPSVTTNTPTPTNTNTTTSIGLNYMPASELAAYKKLAWWFAEG